MLEGGVLVPPLVPAVCQQANEDGGQETHHAETHPKQDGVESGVVGQPDGEGAVLDVLALQEDREGVGPVLVLSRGVGDGVGPVVVVFHLRNEGQLPVLLGNKIGQDIVPTHKEVVSKIVRDLDLEPGLPLKEPVQH